MKSLVHHDRAYVLKSGKDHPHDMFHQAIAYHDMMVLTFRHRFFSRFGEPHPAHRVCPLYTSTSITDLTDLTDLRDQ